MSARKYIHANGLISAGIPPGAEVIETTDGRFLVRTERDVIVTVREDAGRDREIVVRKGASNRYVTYIYEQLVRKVVADDGGELTESGFDFGKEAPEFFQTDMVVVAQRSKPTTPLIRVRTSDTEHPVCYCTDARYIEKPQLIHSDQRLDELHPDQRLDTLNFAQDEGLDLFGTVRNLDEMVRQILSSEKNHMLASLFVFWADAYGIAKRMKEKRSHGGETTTGKKTKTGKKTTTGKKRKTQRKG